jgi:hypothetical protein
MTQEATATVTADRVAALKGFARVAGRYGLNAAGPVSIAAAHFISALVFLQLLPPAEFGLIAFAFVAVPLFLSVAMSLTGASLYTTAYRQDVAQAAQTLHLKANLSISLAAGVVLMGLMLGCGAGWQASFLFGVYAAAMSLRQFARCFAYVNDRPFTVVASDVSYSVDVLFGVGVLYLLRDFGVFGLREIALVLASAAIVAMFPFGAAYLERQLSAGFGGWFSAYRIIWRDLARWSLLGVILTEVTVNAHAYLVTLIAGPAAFALIAAGALFLRPVSLFLTAIPDLERASMARGIVGGDPKAALASVRTFQIAGAVAWAATLAATAATLIWFPSVVPGAHYPVADVAIVVAIWAAIMAVRVVRTPDSVLLQAAAEFKALAHAAVISGIVSFTLALALLLAFGPVASLAGILVGETVMMVRVRLLLRNWMRCHG